MTSTRAVSAPLVLILALAGCGDGTGPDAPLVDCGLVSATVLAPGQFAVVDASEVACVRLPEAGTGGAEYLYVAASAAGEESTSGTSADYELTGSGGSGGPVAAARPRGPSPAVRPTAAQRLHLQLREVGRRMASRPDAAVRARTAPAVRTPPPVLGEQRTFNVLQTLDLTGTADDYAQVNATARYVGTRAAIFLDDAAPVQGGYSQADLDNIGSLFDDHLHPIGTAAFGAESDINSDGLVLVLLTEKVTQLAGCGGNQFVVGFFFAADLFANHPQNNPGSNEAEIFYGLVPDPVCGVDRDRAVELLPAVFVHEFQHMISYNEHVLSRGGQAEDTWLDEGLSGFAEELGARQVPDDRCVDNDCLNQFMIGNLTNAYNYLRFIDDSYLIGPSQPPIPLTEYGATWLFVRWLTEHFASDPTLGLDLTRQLVQTNRIGAANVSAVVGLGFDALISEWQLANYLTDLPGFAPGAGSQRLQYDSWAFRDIYASFHAQDNFNFPRVYPLEPEVTAGDDYLRIGVLRAGSGQHVLIQQGPSAGVVSLRLTRPDDLPLPSSVVPRAVLVRIR